MPSNKKHHYVPRFYLRNFSPDRRSINIFNIDHQRIIADAPFKNQCYRDYYYGRDQKLEGILSEIEGSSAAILSSIIATGALPQSNDGRSSLSVYLMAQHGRTPGKIAVFSEANSKLIAAIKEFDAGRNPTELPDLAQVDPVGMSVCLSIKSYRLLADLEPRLLLAVPGQEFITSDTPVVFCNKFFAFRPMGDAAAPGWQGFQLFFPISPTMMLHLFDPSIYSVLPRDSSSILQLNNQRDMDQLNGLQVASAHENIFFRDSSVDIEKLVKIFLQFNRRTDAVNLHVIRPDNNENREIFAMQIGGIVTPLDLSFIAVKAGAKKWRAQFQQQRLQPAVVSRPTAHIDIDEARD